MILQHKLKTSFFSKWPYSIRLKCIDLRIYEEKNYDTSFNEIYGKILELDPNCRNLLFCGTVMLKKWINRSIWFAGNTILQCRLHVMMANRDGWRLTIAFMHTYQSIWIACNLFSFISNNMIRHGSFANFLLFIEYSTKYSP